MPDQLPTFKSSPVVNVSQQRMLAALRAAESNPQSQLNPPTRVTDLASAEALVSADPNAIPLQAPPVSKPADPVVSPRVARILNASEPQPATAPAAQPQQPTATAPAPATKPNVPLPPRGANGKYSAKEARALGWEKNSEGDWEYRGKPQTTTQSTDAALTGQGMGLPQRDATQGQAPALNFPGLGTPINQKGSSAGPKTTTIAGKNYVVSGGRFINRDTGEELRRPMSATEKSKAEAAENAKSFTLTTANQKLDALKSLKANRKGTEGLSGSALNRGLGGLSAWIGESPESDAEADLKYISNADYLQAFSALKGGGAVSNQEGEAARGAISMLNNQETRRSSKKFHDQLDKAIAAQEKLVTRLKAFQPEAELDEDTPAEK